MAKVLIVAGLSLLLLGIAWPWLQKSGLGHLPGDISIKTEKYSFHFPLVTCLVLSVGVSFLLWLIRMFR